MRAILIRHGETDGNKTHYVGRHDLPLNRAGTEQVARLAAATASEQISHIFSSPLMRAADTASPLARQRGVQVTFQPELMEFNFGNLIGLPKTDQKLSLRKQHRTVPVPGGESLQDVWMRLQPLCAEVLGLIADGANVALVGHYWSNRILAEMLVGKTFATALDKTGLAGSYKPPTASAYCINFTWSGSELQPESVTWLHEGAA